MEEDKNVEQPGLALQIKLDEIMSATPTVIDFRGRKVSIPWIRHYTERRLTHEMLRKKDGPHKRNVKVCALILLNNMWLIRLFYWAVWRYYYYFADLDEVDIMRVLSESKKKIQSEACLLNTTLAIGMMDTMMTVTKEDQKLTQAGLHGVPDIH